MNNEQYLLEKLGEECVEVSLIASKAKQFGLESNNNGLLPRTNKEEIHRELDDVMAQIEMLNEETDFNYTPNREAINAKKEKMKHYRNISIQLGKIKP